MLGNPRKANGLPQGRGWHSGTLSSHFPSPLGTQLGLGFSGVFLGALAGEFVVWKIVTASS